ncbi:MAG: efflux RND transporter periplasmic adaptor subunit [Ignavibacteria bacterium]|nr:efflux RND transporter periplasmic adaptor subunit [Ignavibacteria bacterium]MBP6509238.1 efflux RND transporter periplasmic adaptor subunit [Candidatus Kapabacteria bacterium]MBK6417870.1 efflux RND transporter periplasmic adaptor subunit [Ignavibacteria bacterium]MBK6760898.1 efflux RND transporter periplasmic adaptor subunit [Ignavibacteria bacterium]MBK7031908.1 efflux RND transporter periplasmic adaptor subunit [Ignavibacteria bacterium]
MTFRTISSIVLIGIVTMACSKDTDKPLEQQLDSLRTEKAKIEEKITELQKKLGKVNTPLAAQPVTTITAAMQSFAHVLDAKGTVDSRSSLQITPQMAGRIVRVNVVNGEAISKGQLLVELDAEIVRKGIEEVKTQLDFAVTMFEKQKRIYDQKAGSEVQYLSAKNQKESLERRLESLNEQLAMSRVVAPTSGFADNVVAKVGENVAPGMPLLTVVNTSDMRVVVDLAESFIGTVTTGDPVTIQYQEISDSMKTKINVVAKSVNPVSRTFRVEIPVRPVPPNLRPNTTCRVLINDVTVASTIVMPLTAVLHDNIGSYVYIVDDKSTARRREVQTGLTSGGNVQIVMGLSVGENVIVRGAVDVADGQIVRTVK